MAVLLREGKAEEITRTFPRSTRFPAAVVRRKEEIGTIAAERTKHAGNLYWGFELTQWQGTERA